MSKEQVHVAVVRLPHGADLPLPHYATPDSAGMDLLAAVTEEIVIQPGERSIVPTGLAIALPRGYEGQLRPRSGLAFRHGVTVLNSPGTVDADYRGEVGVLLINHGAEPFTVSRGDRIAQLVVASVEQSVWVPVESLEESERGAGGFGSTGVSGTG